MSGMSRVGKRANAFENNGKLKKIQNTHCLCTYAYNLGCCARILFICEGMGFRRPGSRAGCHTNTFSRHGACGQGQRHTLYRTAMN